VLKMNAHGSLEVDLNSAIGGREPLDAIQSVVERWRPQQSVRTSNPLRAAILLGSPLEIVQYLYGCYPGAIREMSIYWCWDLPLHLVKDKTRPECVRFLVDRYPEALAVRNTRGELPLYCAIKQGAGREVIQMLVLGRPDSIEEFDPKGRREGPRVLPVHVAAATPGPHQLDVMRYLVERSPESVGEWTPPNWGLESARGCLPLHLTLRYGADPSVVRFLLKQWRGSAQERAGPLLPLHLAAKHMRITTFEEVARSLLDAFPEALRDTDVRGSTVFHWACSGEVVLSRLELLLRLVGYWPEALLAADAAGNLPIHVALRDARASRLLFEWQRQAGVLAKACPESVRVANSKGQRPLHLAIAANNLPVVRMFEDRSSGLLREAADANGNTPAHLVAACEQASADLARHVADAWPESLLAVNKDGDTPTHVAIDRAINSSTEKVEKVKIFVERCPESLCVVNRKGRRPLFAAIARNRADLARLIVTNDPEAARHVDARGRTAAHLAASLEEGWSAPALVRFLADAYPTALRMRDVKGNLPLILAAANGKMDVNALFLLLKACPDVVEVGRQRSASSAFGGVARSAKRPRSPSMG
jgi:ankyrin repeat protein